MNYYTLLNRIHVKLELTNGLLRVIRMFEHDMVKRSDHRFTLSNTGLPAFSTIIRWHVFKEIILFFFKWGVDGAFSYKI